MKGGKRVGQLYELTAGTWWADSPATGYYWTPDGTLAMDPTDPAPSPRAAEKRAYVAGLVQGHAAALQRIMRGHHVTVHHADGTVYGMASYDPRQRVQEVALLPIEINGEMPTVTLERCSDGLWSKYRADPYAVARGRVDEHPRGL